ncbi:MAG: glycosyltransferase family 39 protein [Anaerolineales bacterium]|nr:glycosyltransferase family 39 protein [Anaerolineales bacterium]
MDGQAIRKLLEWFRRPGPVLTGMMLLQLCWLAAIWITGASTNGPEILLLALFALLAWLTAILMPDDLRHRLEGWRGRLMPNRKTAVVVFLVIVISAGVFYAVYQRGWTFDEDHSLEAAHIVATEGPAALFAQYADIPWLGRQHPPLMPLLNGAVMRIFGEGLFTIRLFSLLFGLGTLAVTYALGRELYDAATGQLAAVLLMTFPLVLRLSTAALTDVQVTFFFTLAIYLAVRTLRAPSWGTDLLLGLVVGLGLLTKYTMVMVGPVLVLFFLINRRAWRLWYHYAVAALIAGILIGGWFLYAYQLGVLTAQRETIDIEPGFFVTNVGGLRWMANSLLTKLPSSIGVYHGLLLLLSGITLLRQRQWKDWFLLLWIASVSIVLIITLPDHRYFMPTFPAMSIMIALWLMRQSLGRKRAVFLAFLYAGSALWLFLDWYRASELFIG